MDRTVIEVAAIVARLLIGAVLLYAGFSKLRSRRWHILAMETGAPRSAVVALPVVEALVGLALILLPTSAQAAWVALALLVLFTGFVVRQLVAGRRAPCNCFGGDGEEAAGWRTVVRNLILIALAFLATL